MKSVNRLLVLFLILFGTFANAQELKLSRLFADHMVLQRETPTRFWGSAGSNETVSITIDGFQSLTRADESGKWECLFPAHVAGGPFSVSVKASAEIKISDVYFGDVWIAGGQSNMEWKVNGDITNMNAEIADSNYPLIRFFEVPKKVSVKPQSDIDTGEWKVANSENAPNFSAVAWFFAKKNHLEKNVPVGVIGSYWGGTPAEAWTSIEILEGIEGYKEKAAEVLDPNKDWTQTLKENDEKSKKKWDMIWDKEGSIASGVQKVDFDDSGWETINLPNKEPMAGFAWVRKKISLKSTKNVMISLGRITQLAQMYVNGNEVLDKKWGQLVPIEIPSEFLVKGENVIAIRAINDWDNRVTVGNQDEFWIQVGKRKIALNGEWKYSNTIERAMPEVVNYTWTPSFLFNGMINPIAGYSIKGAIWYQGESNAGVPQYYRELFGAMIQDWRVRWEQGNFPFLFVQLANWQARKPDPSESNWAKLQEAQTQTLELPNTGMATIIDIGEADDIHPKNKKDVGDRLWLAGRKAAFGEDIIYSGPTYLSHEIVGYKVVINYENIGSGLKIKGEELTGFALAGEDKKFYWAQGKIEGAKISISSEKVTAPMYIRYAWADNPACNLYNLDGLPAVPFRTD